MQLASRMSVNESNKGKALVLIKECGFGDIEQGSDKWWPHLDLNQGPIDYESSALTN